MSGSSGDGGSARRRGSSPFRTEVGSLGAFDGWRVIQEQFGGGFSSEPTAFRYPMSRPSEKFRFEPSRKFLLTAVRQKDGTNCDEPGGTRLFGLVETG